MVHADKKKYQHVLLALIWMRDVEGKEYTVPEMTRYLGEAQGFCVNPHSLRSFEFGRSG
jgi:hypothetical protein